jgi:succinate-semialdehyde dehydrogenase/glutarate-semialdehyde dehydrogenase
VSSDLATRTGLEAPTGLLIGGEWSPGRGGVLPVIDPATEQPIGEVADATADDALDAVSASAASACAGRSS